MLLRAMSLLSSRYDNGERSTPAFFRRDADRAAVIVDPLLHNRETEAGACLFSRKVRLKHFRNVFRGNTVSYIDDLYLNRVLVRVRKTDRNTSAPAVDRFDGINHQIRKHRTHRLAVRQYVRQRTVLLDLRFDSALTRPNFH